MKTIIEPFDKTYHHISAPMKEDRHWGKNNKTRRLYNPLEWMDPSTWKERGIDADNFTSYLKDSFSEDYFFELRNHPWTFKRKIDGTNIRIQWDGEQAKIFGKTNKANMDSIPGFKAFMEERFLEERFEEKFGHDKMVYLYGEWAGPKVQKNDLNLVSPEFVLFDVEINGIFLDSAGICDVSQHFGVSNCYSFNTTDLCDCENKSLLDWIDYVAKGNIASWEGIVVEPSGQLRSRTGNRIIAKIKNVDYQVKICK